MKKMDYVFWIVLGFIALFYILKGNEMHTEKYEKIKEKIEKKEELK
ncbi:MAG: hypothetical protein KBE77_06525 [Aliarcobacter sp.]|nr:hypothetical protein [Aliarcobacter sp.]